MPKYYCDYCDKFLTHDSPSVRKTHCTGRTHKNSVSDYYRKWLEEQVQKLVDHASEAYKQGKVPPPMFGAAMGIPPPGIQNAGMPSYPPGFPPLMSVPPLGMRPPPPQGMVPGMRIPLGAQMPPAWAPGPGGMPPMPMPGAPLPPAHLPASGIHPLMSAPGLPPMGPPQ
uniref:U1 small nuclear ribonucleoprotein C n=1 Tax=Schistocephalus solidus TaxID=70667 RepID=A0A0X3PT58_SCHSO